jgi:glycyl-tRNA synthetase
MTKLDEVISLAKRRGFVFPCGDIYGGTRSAWDYGPLGVELKENIKKQWWRFMVTSREDVVGLDSSVILPKEVWVASGHVGVFNDPLTQCLACGKRQRADHLIEGYEATNGSIPDGKTEIEQLKSVKCPDCGAKGTDKSGKSNWTEPKDFNMMLKTYLGPVEDESGLHYLRPETAQGIFVNFLTVMNSSRMKPPFGIGQIGKSFRNEITPGNFIFRTREFEQMEMEFFVKPGEDEKWHEYWLEQRWNWYTNLGINPENLRYFEHPTEKLAHYSKRTVDIEYKFEFVGGDWGELEGIANRTDFDLKTHSQHSGKNLLYKQPKQMDMDGNVLVEEDEYTPYVIEPAAGLTRSLMAFLVDSYDEDEAPNSKGGVDKRVVLRLDYRLSPFKAAVLPLSKKDELSVPAKELASKLRQFWNVDYDDAGAIGRRYRRHDEIGTPFCITFDFDSLEDNSVTIRERDTMDQVRVKIDELEGWLASRLIGC